MGKRQGFEMWSAMLSLARIDADEEVQRWMSDSDEAIHNLMFFLENVRK